MQRPRQGQCAVTATYPAGACALLPRTAASTTAAAAVYISLCVLLCATCIQATPTVDWVALATILVDKAGSQDEFTRITALKWIKVRAAPHTWRCGVLD